MYLDVFHCATNLFSCLLHVFRCFPLCNKFIFLSSLGINGSADDWSTHGQSTNFIYMHAHAYMYAYTHICTHAHTRIHTHVYRCTQRYAWTVFFFSIHISSVWPHLIPHDINFIKLKCTVYARTAFWVYLTFRFLQQFDTFLKNYDWQLQKKGDCALVATFQGQCLLNVPVGVGNM